jgi:hypothetical protein
MKNKLKLVIDSFSEKFEVKLILPFSNDKETDLEEGTYKVDNGWRSVTYLTEKEANGVLTKNAMPMLYSIVTDTVDTINNFENHSELHQCKDKINKLIHFISEGYYSDELLNELYESHEILGVALNHAKHNKEEVQRLDSELVS